MKIQIIIREKKLMNDIKFKRMFDINTKKELTTFKKDLKIYKNSF